MHPTLALAAKTTEVSLVGFVILGLLFLVFVPRNAMAFISLKRVGGSVIAATIMSVFYLGMWYSIIHH
jgi:hypothetical protein